MCVFDGIGLCVSLRTAEMENRVLPFWGGIGSSESNSGDQPLFVALFCPVGLEGNSRFFL